MAQKTPAKLTDLLGRNRTSTYQQIQNWVQENHGFLPKTCWIAHCKELNGLPLGRAPNRKGLRRVEPCPEYKRGAIEDAFRHFGMLT